MFWENYLQLCNKVGKSANAVAAEIGFKSSGTVTGWKDGKIPYERNLKKIADYFGVTVDDLIGDDSAQKEKPTAQGDGLISDLPQDVQDLISLCQENPQFASALINLAQQIQNRSSGQA
jgi:transcriptional regulator with XRE-family HTH domain